MVSEVSPREHAAEILKLRTREERKARLEECPESMRDIVKTHVENAMAKQKAAKGG